VLIIVFSSATGGVFSSAEKGGISLPCSCINVKTFSAIEINECIELTEEAGAYVSAKTGLSNGVRKTFSGHPPLPFCRFMNSITPTKATWNGGNASGWKSDILAINGFNEMMQYGGQDREFGERLVNLGLKSKQIRYSAILLHLDHSRPYKTAESIAKNVAIRQKTRREKIIVTPFGIKQYLSERNI